jgi:O-antigen ligase
MISLMYSIENTLNNRILGHPLRWLEHNVPVWLPSAIILGVLLLSLALPVLAPSRLLMLLLVLVPAAGALLAFFRWPPLGIIALIVAALILPSPDLPGGFNLAVLLLVLLIGLWLVDLILGQRKTTPVSSRTFRPLLALVAVAVLAFGVGQLPWFTFGLRAPLDAQIGGLVMFVLAAGAFLLVAHQVRDLRWLQWMTWLFLALGTLYIAGWLVPVPGIGQLANRLFQPGTYNNSMLWTWLVALAFGQALYNRKLHMGWRLALGGLALATLFVAFFMNRGWKSGYLPAMVVVAAIIGLRSWRLGLAVVLAGIVPATYIGSQAIATDQYSYSTRLEAWKIVLEMAKVNPLTGFGPANYYWYARLYRIRGYSSVLSSHNQYVDLIGQTGLLGLACFCWFAGELGWLGWRLRNQAPAGFAQAYVYGALGGLVGTLAAGALADWIVPFVYNIGLTGFRASMLAWLFLGGLVSIEQIVRRQAQPQAANDAV